MDLKNEMEKPPARKRGAFLPTLVLRSGRLPETRELGDVGHRDPGFRVVRSSLGPMRK